MEELERQLLAVDADSSMDNSKKSSPKIKTLEEIEAEMLNTSLADTAERLSPAEELEKIRQSLHGPARSKSFYDGLMLESEKQFVAKVQLGHVANDPTYETDFYFKSFKANKVSEVGGKKQDSEAHLLQNMLNQVKEYNKNKTAKLDIKGSLGKIVPNYLRNPKRIMEVKIEPSAQITKISRNTEMHTTNSIREKIENVYLYLLKIDDLFKEYQDDQSQDPEIQRERNTRFTKYTKLIWDELHNLAPQYDRNISSSSSSDRLNSAPPASGLSLMLSFGKGRKSISKLLNALPSNQSYLLLKSIVMSHRNLLLTAKEPAAVLSELEEYATYIVFPYVQFISKLSLKLVVEIINSLIDTQNVVSIAKTKPGLLLLTLLISRAEIIKQKADADSADIADWETSVFPKFFSQLENQFASLFPPSHIIPSIMDSSSTSQISRPIPVDETYVWNFLAALAASSTIEQHRVLVSEARDKIFEIISQGPSGVKKVDLFLNALGLDSSQLME